MNFVFEWQIPCVVLYYYVEVVGYANGSFFKISLYHRINRDMLQYSGRDKKWIHIFQSIGIRLCYQFVYVCASGNRTSVPLSQNKEKVAIARKETEYVKAYSTRLVYVETIGNRKGPKHGGVRRCVKETGMHPVQKETGVIIWHNVVLRATAPAYYRQLCTTSAVMQLSMAFCISSPAAVRR